MRRPLAAALLLLLFATPAAAAHANLYSSQPVGGTRLETPPGRVEVVLTEPIDPKATSLVVEGTDGRRVDNDDLAIENGAHPRLSVGLPADLAPGGYLIKWRTLSTTDQHTTGGTIGFAVGSFDPPAGGESAPAAFRWDAVVARALIFSGIAALAGALAFLTWIDRDPNPARSALYGRVAAYGAGLHLVGVMTLWLSTRAATGLAAPALLETFVGRFLAARLALAALLFAATLRHAARPGRPIRWAIFALATAAALGSARFGHNSLNGTLAILNDALHLGATATWTGALLVFLIVLASAARLAVDAPAARTLGIRLGHVALPSVALLAATGIVATLGILGPSRALDAALWTSAPYLQVLAAKVLLAVAMVLIGAINRYGYLAHSESTHPAARLLRGRVEAVPQEAGTRRPRSFARLVGTEASIGCAVLVLAAFLTSISPPPVAAAAADELRLTAADDDFALVLHLEPAPTVGNASTLRFTITNLQTNEAETDNTCGAENCVHARVLWTDDPEAGPEERAARPDGDGNWVTTAVLFVRPGNYTIEVDVQTEYVYLSTLSFHFALAWPDAATRPQG